MDQSDKDVDFEDDISDADEIDGFNDDMTMLLLAAAVDDDDDDDDNDFADDEYYYKGFFDNWLPQARVMIMTTYKIVHTMRVFVFTLSSDDCNQVDKKEEKYQPFRHGEVSQSDERK
ncbi:hypothetical protein PoB_006437500 [Plakobranchus ocellatus]|uniref:Uncharacterized protein n=1 Tax=Plakobranchus ocellatus TaxID=259542 RepID=A0AAV4D184_9GAST|nr:hypothetical protein PoB_006437500 [Plakobranchus ocellatus]